MMVSRSSSPMSVCRVRKLSMNPAMINKGTVPATIFMPRRAPHFKLSRREYVPGKSHPLPIAKPAAPATMMDDSSSVP